MWTFQASGYTAVCINMAVRKQRRMKSLKGRTINIKNRAHWDKVLGKMGDRLLIVHYSAVRRPVFMFRWRVPAFTLRP